MVDFTTLANTAQRLIANTPGRTVTFKRLDRNPADAQRPWRGATDPRANPDATSSQVAVFVPASVASASGLLGRRSESDQLIARTDQVALVAPGAASTEDLATFDAVDDQDASEWKITFVETLAPSDINIRVLYVVGLRR